MIEEYNFGKITIDGKVYDKDIQTDWNGNVSEWLRQEDKIIGITDVAGSVEKEPQSLVIGTGQKGMVKLAEEAKIFIQERGIELFMDETEEAVRTFNILKEDSLEGEGVQEKVIGLFCLKD
jgi:hypothetical protein